MWLFVFIVEMFSQHLILLTHKKKAHSITWVGNKSVTKGGINAPERALYLQR